MDSHENLTEFSLANVKEEPCDEHYAHEEQYTDEADVVGEQSSSHLDLSQHTVSDLEGEYGVNVKDEPLNSSYNSEAEHIHVKQEPGSDDDAQFEVNPGVCSQDQEEDISNYADNETDIEQSIGNDCNLGEDALEAEHTGTHNEELPADEDAEVDAPGTSQLRRGVNCPVCCKYLSNRTKLGIHMRCHNSTSLLVPPATETDVPAQQLDESAVLPVEDDTRTDYRYMCKVCGTPFQRLTQLHIHQRCHNSQALSPDTVYAERNTSLKKLAMKVSNHTALPKFRTKYSKSTHIANILKEREDDKSDIEQSSPAAPKGEATEPEETVDETENCGEMMPVTVHSSITGGVNNQPAGGPVNDDRWTCVVCAKSFANASKLTIHQRCHNSRDLPMVFRCHRCGRTSKSADELRAHIRECQDARKFECELCHYAFRRAYDLWEHKQTHTGAKPFPCTVCGKAFIVEESLNTHMATHGDVRPFRCSKCGATFKLPGMLSRHMRAHAISAGYACKVCEKVSGSLESLAKHILTTHPDYQKKADWKYQRKTTTTNRTPLPESVPSNEVHECNICHKKFENIKSVALHRKSHQQKAAAEHSRTLGPHSTNSPKRKVESKQLSKRSKRPNSLICNLCGKIFSDEVRFVKHQAIHAGDSPQSCAICDKKFVWSGALLYHKLVHGGERPFQCDYCEQTFEKSPLMTRHKQLHHTDRTIDECDLCHSKFKSSSDVDIHKLMAHADTEKSAPWVCSVCRVAFTQSVYLHEHEQYHLLDDDGEYDEKRSVSSEVGSEDDDEADDGHNLHYEDDWRQGAEDIKVFTNIKPNRGLPSGDGMGQRAHTIGLEETVVRIKQEPIDITA